MAAFPSPPSPLFIPSPHLGHVLESSHTPMDHPYCQSNSSQLPAPHQPSPIPSDHHPYSSNHPSHSMDHSARPPSRPSEHPYRLRDTTARSTERPHRLADNPRPYQPPTRLADEPRPFHHPHRLTDQPRPYDPILPPHHADAPCSPDPCSPAPCTSAPCSPLPPPRPMEPYLPFDDPALPNAQPMRIPHPSDNPQLAPPSQVQVQASQKHPPLPPTPTLSSSSVSSVDSPPPLLTTPPPRPDSPRLHLRDGAVAARARLRQLAVWGAAASEEREDEEEVIVTRVPDRVAPSPIALSGGPLRLARRKSLFSNVSSTCSPMQPAVTPSVGVSVPLARRASRRTQSFHRYNRGASGVLGPRRSAPDEFDDLEDGLLATRVTETVVAPTRVM